MKRVLIILVAIIGFGFSALALCNFTSISSVDVIIKNVTYSDVTIDNTENNVIASNEIIAKTETYAVTEGAEECIS